MEGQRTYNKSDTKKMWSAAIIIQVRGNVGRPKNWKQSFLVLWVFLNRVERSNLKVGQCCLIIYRCATWAPDYLAAALIMAGRDKACCGCLVSGSKSVKYLHWTMVEIAIERCEMHWWLAPTAIVIKRYITAIDMKMKTNTVAW